jgi:hypothetical protein
MILAYTDGRQIGELTNLKSAKPIGQAPVEFSAEISAEGASMLRSSPAPFYRASLGEERFTLSIDHAEATVLSGTIRRR